jgi:hypothetical protein
VMIPNALRYRLCDQFGANWAKEVLKKSRFWFKQDFGDGEGSLLVLGQQRCPRSSCPDT